MNETEALKDALADGAEKSIGEVWGEHERKAAADKHVNPHAHLFAHLNKDKNETDEPADATPVNPNAHLFAHLNKDKSAAVEEEPAPVASDPAAEEAPAETTTEEEPKAPEALESVADTALETTPAEGAAEEASAAEEAPAATEEASEA